MVSAITSQSQISATPVVHKVAPPAHVPPAAEPDPNANASTAGQSAGVPAAPRQAPDRASAQVRKSDQMRDMAQMRKNLQEAIERINEMMRDGGRELHFSIDDELDRSIIIVKNQETGEVIRQIPADVVLKVAQSIEDLKGMLHNEAV